MRNQQKSFISKYLAGACPVYLKNCPVQDRMRTTELTEFLQYSGTFGVRTSSKAPESGPSPEDISYLRKSLRALAKNIDWDLQTSE